MLQNNFSGVNYFAKSIIYHSIINDDDIQHVNYAFEICQPQRNALDNVFKRNPTETHQYSLITSACWQYPCFPLHNPLNLALPALKRSVHCYLG